MRDRAQELLDEEAALAVDALGDVGRDRRPRRSRACRCRSTGCSRTRRRAATALLAAPESPDTPHLAATGFDPVVGDTEGLAAPAASPARRRRTASCSPPTGEGSAGRLADVLAGEGVEPRSAASRRAGSAIVVAPARARRRRAGRGPRAHRRGRPHRAPPRAPPAARRAQRAPTSTTTLEPGDFVVHHQHGVGRYEGMVDARDRRRRARLPAARVPGRRQALRADRPGRRRAPLHRRRDAHAEPHGRRRLGEDPRPCRGRGAARSPQELVVLYRRRLATPGPRLRTRHAVAARDRGGVPVRGDARPAAGDRGRQGRHGAAGPDGPARVRRRRVRQDRGRDPGRVQGRAGRQAGRGARRRRRCSPTSTARRSASASRTTRCASRCCRGSSTARGAGRRGRRRHRAARSTSSSARTACCPTTSRFKDLGLLVVDEEQRFGVQHKEKIKQLRADVDVLTLTATPIPRTLEMSLTGIRDLSLVNTPPEDRQPILTYVGEYDDRAVAEAIRRELLREGQVFFVHNRVQDIELRRPSSVRELVPEARVAIAHGQMDEGRLERVVLDFCGARVRRARLHDDRRERARHADGQHARRRPRRSARPRAAVPAARPGRSPRPARLRVPPAPAPTASLTEEAYERLQDDRRVHRPRLRVQDRHARPRDPRRRQPARRRAVRPHRRRRLRPLLPARHRGGRRAEGRDAARRRSRSTIDVPVDAHLPTRLREPRRRAHGGVPAARRGRRRRPTSTTSAAEWHDRYGPPPPPAEALLDVARLRAECVRVGHAQRVGPEGHGAHRRPRAAGVAEGPAAPARAPRRWPRTTARSRSPSRDRGREACAALVDLLGELVPARRSRAGSIRRAVRTLLRSSFALAGVAAVLALAGCSAVRPAALTVNGDRHLAILGRRRAAGHRREPRAEG